MGAVYEAEEQETGRRVALKVLSRKLDSETARNRFLREGRLAASINHPSSVYVFGTEEIEGTPAIAMELVPGGTLHDKVREGGPMPVTRAVDVMLQIIAGLDAAQKVGILHRDVKPSNCFTDASGLAKIGDFGLSISTEGHSESHFTVEGTLLGTPAFASPEQLRGDILNAQSDMYSVGATLFYLLSGNAPFEESNMVRLLARVLEEPAPAIRQRRPEVPAGLAAIITKCLSKSPGDRFKSYAHLRKALEPFGSSSPTPATLALRFAAYAIDSILVGIAGFLIQLIGWGGNFGSMINPDHMFTGRYMWILTAGTLTSGLYFALFEGLRGATPGKALARLRVVNCGGSPAGFWRVVLRVAILFAIQGLPIWIFFFAEPSSLERASPLIGGMLGLGNVVMIGLTFITARRRNGYAGLHELWSGTRVAHTPALMRRPGVPSVSQRTPPGDESLNTLERIGPYGLLERMGSSQHGNEADWFLGYDPKLMRKVWISRREPGADLVPDVQRRLQRPGRLRWIASRRESRENWDVFEALDGTPLLALSGEFLTWDSMRFWLLDLATELKVAQEDGSLPERLAFDRIWITAEGRARLLDFRCPGLRDDIVARGDAGASRNPEDFLRDLARLALPESRSGAAPLPFHATRTLQRLEIGEAGPRLCGLDR